MRYFDSRRITGIVFGIMMLLLLPAVAQAAWNFQQIATAVNFDRLSPRSMAVDKNSSSVHLAFGKNGLYHAYRDSDYGNYYYYEVIDDSPGVGEYASIAIDTSGNLHISYYDSLNGDLKYATNSLGVWQTIVVDTVNVGMENSIATDSSNKVHISYYDSRLKRLKYATNAGGSWQISILDSNEGGRYSSIAVDRNDRIHISYYGSTLILFWWQYGLKYLSNSTGSWAAEPVDAAVTEDLYSSIAVDSNGKAHISYADGSLKRLKYATNNSGGWVTETVDASGYAYPWDGIYSSIAVDSSNSVHIAYYCETASAGWLSYASNSSGNWLIETADNSEFAGKFCSLALDSSGNILIGYMDFWRRAIYQVTRGQGGWSRNIVVDGGARGENSAMALDHNDRVHASFFDAAMGNWYCGYVSNVSGRWELEVPDYSWGAYENTAIAIDSNNYSHISFHNSALRYATDMDGYWRSEVVDPSPDVGKSSIATDSADNVHIAYYDKAAQLLRYATNAPGYWIAEVVDDTVDSGLHNSIAVGSNGLVHISYYDNTNHYLWYATRTADGWETTMVDSDGDVGQYNSLRLDLNDYAHISYYDVTYGCLKYANYRFDFAYGFYWDRQFVDCSSDVGLYSSLGLDSSSKAHVSYYDQTNSLLKYATNSSGTWIASVVDDAGEVGEYSSLGIDHEDKVHITYFDRTDGSLKYATNAPLDLTPPVGSVVINGGEPYTNNYYLNLTLSCSDLQNSCSRMRLTDDIGYYWNYWFYEVPFGPAYIYDIWYWDGPQKVYASFMDSAGNWSDPVYDEIILDATAPVTTAAPAGSSYTSAQTVYLSCADGTGIGCGETYYSFNNGCPLQDCEFSPCGVDPDCYLYTGPVVINDNVTLTFYSFDRLGNVETIRSEQYTFVPSDTELSLYISDTLIDTVDKVTLWGRLHNQSNNGAVLTGMPITIKYTHEDKAGVKTSGILGTTAVYNENGDYMLQGLDGFQTGSYIIHAEFAGSGLLASNASPPVNLLVGVSAGYAIIIEGKIGQTPDPYPLGEPSHNKTANRIYQRLKQRGFVDENIFYFNYDMTQRGVDSTPIKASVKNTLETVLRDRMNSMPAPLFVIMVDHGSPNAFHINRDTISPTELNAWLLNLENGLSSAALLEKRVVIIGACYSGSFIPLLSRAGRIIITSAASDEVSYKGPKEDDNIRSGEFFLEELFEQLQRGASLKSAFSMASENTRIFTRQGSGSSNANAPYFDGAIQHPLLDDNADGRGSNSFSDGAGADGAGSAGLVLGVGPDAVNSFLNQADISEVTPTAYLAGSLTGSLLYAAVNDITQVDAAPWIEVRGPSMILSKQSGSGQASLDLTKIPLVYNSASARYEQDPAMAIPPEPFEQPGLYEIYYFVKDKETLKVAPMKRSLVYKDRPNNAPPSAFSLLEPADAGLNQKKTPRLVWEQSLDQDTVTYTVWISESPQFTAYKAFEGISETSFLLGQDAGLEDGKTYYWKVIAIDRYGAQTNSCRAPGDCSAAYRSFRVNDPNVSLVRLSGRVKDSSTGAAIIDAQITSSTGGGPWPSLAPDGEYFISLPPGATDITVTAAGYNNAVITNYFVANQESVLLDITMSKKALAVKTLAVIKSGSGSVTTTPASLLWSGNTGTASFNTGAVVQLTAEPALGSYFTGWSGDCAGFGSGNPIKLTMDAAKNCTATFALMQFNITVSKSGIGTGSIVPVPGSYSYSYGSSLTLSAQPAANNAFMGWSGSPDCADGRVTVDANKTCTATFSKNSFPLSVTKTGSGAVTASPVALSWNGSTGAATYTYDQTAQLTATPDSGWLFSGWGGNCQGTASVIQVPMSSAKNCTATFILNVHTLGITISGPGTGRVTPGSAPPYIDGTIVTLTALPDANSTFIGWSGDTDCTDGSLIMDADKSCIATFGSSPIAAPVKRMADSSLHAELQGVLDLVAGDEEIRVTSGYYGFAPAAISTGLNCDGRTIKLQGGSDTGFALVSGAFTSFTGSLTIRYGSMHIEGIMIK